MGGGSFHINEFGMVLVPSTKNWAEKRYIGDFTGSLEFYNPDTDEIIQLKDDFGYKTGDLWDKPYIGGCFKLSYNDKVSVNRVWEDETTNIILPSDRTDYELIRRIRSIKGTGGCRFVVNMYGIVITKVQIGHQWKSKYVGRINYDKWFRREDYYEHTYF
ncbi:MAG: hypothetical protein CVV64_16245 [Candidatus Wallbacteria bacterium HGW-Wallbacteria-1]|uniref:Uncharacterized protein n=1 Tax=Candidatus Wallbacteria bacterium HGW-Wallbacteria-1 TaxID=2013854 RepID=A0A2N1PL32_9BACT|nr:MAG: hypothetical protein CVV64_16245 [Candidatus Wallbacteria bacterium HGW-Wallbacteria-1]